VPRKIEHQSKACTESRRRSGLRRQCTVSPNNSAPDGARWGAGGVKHLHIDEAMTSHECVHKLPLRPPARFPESCRKASWVQKA
jgi:hypothetical protein